MVGEACLPSNAYYPRTPDYTLCSGVHVCWSEHSDSSFVYGFMSLDYGFGTMTATTYYPISRFPLSSLSLQQFFHENLQVLYLDIHKILVYIWSQLLNPFKTYMNTMFGRFHMTLIKTVSRYHQHKHSYDV